MSKTKQGQSFIDKVVQQTGSRENAVQMALKNNVSITGNASIGTQFITAGTIRPGIVDYYISRRIEPATGITKEIAAAVEDYGIGSMAIESTFIVR